MLSKEECLKKAKELSYGWHIGNNEFVPLKDVNKLIREIYSIKPYEFEDLKVGMWVYDIKYDEFCRIDFIAGIYPHRSYSDGTCEDGAFEENRFYPVQMANFKESED